MAAPHAALLGLMSISADNDAIRMKENTTLGGTGLATVTIAHGDYFLRGDGTSDDFLVALVTALNSHGNVTNPNTYSATVAWSTDASAKAAVVTIHRLSGTSSFELLLSNALTTFDEAAIGFANSDTAFDGNDKVSTLSPLAAWVSPEVLTSHEPAEEYDVSVVRSRSGRVTATRRGGPYTSRVLAHQLVDSRRVLRADNSADEAATFASFIEQHGDGKRFELHEQTESGNVLGALSSSTRVGTFVFDEATAAKFSPTRQEPGLALYSFNALLLEYVA